MADPLFVEQDHWKWYDDDDTDPDLTTALSTEDLTYEVPLADRDTSHHLRITYSNTGGMQASGDFTLQSNTDGGGFQDVDASSTNVRLIAGMPDDDDACDVQRLASGTGGFQFGKYEDSGGAITKTLSNGDFQESVYSVEFRSADLSGGESITFRMQTGGADFDAYNVTPIVTIQSSGVDELAMQGVIVMQ